MKTLNPHQLYLLSEFAEDYLARSMSRRDLLRRSLLATGSIALTATALVALGCSSGDDDETPAATSTTAAAPTATTAAAAEPSATVATATTTTTAASEPTTPASTEDEAGDVSFPGPASEIVGYLARPGGDGPFAAILIIHENRGLLPHFEDVARRYASEGFVAFVPDLASRLGGTDVAGQQVGQIDPNDLVADLQAGIDYLKSLAYVNPEAIGVTGFCFGGGYAFDMAAASPDVKAAVPYYGTARRALQVGLAETEAAVLVMYGETDSRITGERPDVEAALEMTGQPYEIIVHAGAGHAFFNDTGGSYNEGAATAAWEATLAWFREHLPA
jgi:carboxymethylenebutenolidase